MLDSKRYYAAFPDENPETPNLRALLDALKKLEVQFGTHIKQFHVKTTRRSEPTRKAQRGSPIYER
jgi:hypothetical protein